MQHFWFYIGNIKQMILHRRYQANAKYLILHKKYQTNAKHMISQRKYQTNAKHLILHKKYQTNVKHRILHKKQNSLRAPPMLVPSWAQSPPKRQLQGDGQSGCMRTLEMPRPRSSQTAGQRLRTWSWNPACAGLHDVQKVTPGRLQSGRLVSLLSIN